MRTACNFSTALCKLTYISHFYSVTKLKPFYTAERVHCDHLCLILTHVIISNLFWFLSFWVEAGLVITTPQGTLVSPTSSQSFVSGHPTTMIVSALPSHGKLSTLTCTVSQITPHLHLLLRSLWAMNIFEHVRTDCIDRARIWLNKYSLFQ